MTIYQFLEPLKMDFTSKVRLFGIMTGKPDNANLTVENYVKRSRITEVPDWFRVPESLLGSMTEVNRMVKSPDCPNNLKNRFYNQKKSILRKMVKLGRVSDIYDQGDYLAMTVDGKYPFHQPKFYFKDLDYTIAGTQEYTPGAGPIPFDRQKYDEFEAGYYVFVGQYRFMRNGLRHEPKFFQGKKYKAEFGLV